MPTPTRVPARPRTREAPPLPASIPSRVGDVEAGVAPWPPKGVVKPPMYETLDGTQVKLPGHGGWWWVEWDNRPGRRYRDADGTVRRRGVDDWIAAGPGQAETLRMAGLGGAGLAAVGGAWALHASPAFPAIVLAAVLTLAAVGGSRYLLGNVAWEAHWLGEPPRRHLRWSLLAAVGAFVVGLGWLVAAAGWLLGGGTLAVIGWALLAGRIVPLTSRAQWARNATDLRRPAGATEGSAAAVIAKWADTFRPAAKGERGFKASRLVGSYVTKAWQLSDGGWGGVVNVVQAGDATWETVVQERARIAKAWGTRIEWVHVGPYREKNGGTAGHVAVTVHRSDALRDAVPWVPTLDKGGSIRIGIAADGSEVRWPLWRGDQGVRHGLVVGATGSGKSSPLATVLLEAGASSHCWTVLMDPKGGLSIPSATAERVDHLALTETAIIEALHGLHAVMEARVAHQLGNVAPSRKFPAVIGVLDEAPDMLVEHDDAEELVGLVRSIVRKGRAVNVAMYLGAQHPIVDQLGGSTVRAQLANVAAMRLDDAPARNVMTAWLGGVDMAGIPDDSPGRGFVRGCSLQVRIPDPRNAGDVFERVAVPLDPVSLEAWHQHVPEVIHLEEIA